MKKIKKLSNIHIIQLFAVIHAAVSLTSRYLGFADDILLTLLTMLLIVIIFLRHKMNIIFTLAGVILANVLGFAFGIGIAALLNLTSLSALVVHPLSTFICTEILGLAAEFFGSLYTTSHPKARSTDIHSLRILLAVYVGIIFLRLLLVVYLRDSQSQNIVLEMFIDYFFCCVGIVFITECAIRSRIDAEKATEEAGLANYKYIKLKQQVNPHFLFNTLNVLNYLILEKTPSEASHYTHRLAEVYRYMLLSEEKRLVSLREELEFAHSYVDLLKVRFNTGLDVKIDIPEEDMSHSVVPCTFQLLIENATKHNILSATSPLTITIYTTESSVVVTNNVNKRLTKVNSTGFGTKYLQQQYKDIADKSLIINESKEEFTVIIPLL